MKKLFLVISIICFLLFLLNSFGCRDKPIEDKPTKQVVEKKQNIEIHIIDSLLQRYNVLIEKIPTNWEFNDMITDKSKRSKSSPSSIAYNKWVKDFNIVQEQLVDYRQKGKMTAEQINKHNQLSNKHNEFLNRGY